MRFRFILKTFEQFDFAQIGKSIIDIKEISRNRNVRIIKKCKRISFKKKKENTMTKYHYTSNS